MSNSWVHKVGFWLCSHKYVSPTASALIFFPVF